MRETVLVTGGAGFIGSHIVDQLIEAGYPVLVLDNLHTGKRENVHPQARFFEVDLRDAGAVEEVVASERPAIVSHQAALANVRESLTDPVGYVDNNISGTLNLLEAARKHGVRRVLFASTGGAIYGEVEQPPATEAHPAHPLDPYGASKLACEHYLFLYRHNYGLHYVSLRYPNVYGPRQDPHGEAGVVAIFTNRMLQGEQAIINGDGKQRRDFSYVADVARANVLAAERGSGIYNIGTGVGTDINTLFATMAQVTGYDLPPVHGPAKLGEVKTSILDAGLAQVELGWQPAVALKDGLDRTAEYFRR
jgi:UDP-glucose 4-epimerase